MNQEAELKKELRHIEIKKQKVKDSFENEKDWISFCQLTKPIPQKRIPKMPSTNLGWYLSQYNLIQEKKSQLTPTQRIRVKNVVHHYARIGDISLTFE
jgi:hypothetical protein